MSALPVTEREGLRRGKNGIVPRMKYGLLLLIYSPNVVVSTFTNLLMISSSTVAAEQKNNFLNGSHAIPMQGPFFHQNIYLFIYLLGANQK